MIKQVIILRKDLNMRKGKLVSQGCHASMKVFFDLINLNDGEKKLVLDPITPEMSQWIRGSFTKICVSVDSEAELMEIYEKSKLAGIPCSLIIDECRTEFNGVPTKTAVAIGPDTSEKIDPITGHLRLL